jgi:hypothetical protein
MTTETETRSALHIAQEAENAAAIKLREAEGDMQRAIYNASDAIKAEWRPRLHALREAKNKAEAARLEAEVAATTDHKWEGQIVTREETQYARYSSKVTGIKTIKGFVRTYRPGVELPLNRTNFVHIGDVLVFALKKDGTPGRDYEMFSRNEANWTLDVQS